MATKRPRGRPPCDDVLTPAEWRVVRFAQHGLSNPEIAKRLELSINTVKFHLGNALAKSGVANKKALLQWFGTSSHSNLHEAREMNKDNMIDSVGQIARTVTDAAIAEAWYRDVLGLSHLYTFGAMVFFKIGETRLMLSGEAGEALPESILYLQTANIKQTYETLLGRGVTFSNAPHLIHQHEDGTEEWMAFLLDPDERPIGLMSQVPPL